MADSIGEESDNSSTSTQEDILGAKREGSDVTNDDESDNSSAKEEALFLERKRKRLIKMGAENARVKQKCLSSKFNRLSGPGEFKVNSDYEALIKTPQHIVNAFNMGDFASLEMVVNRSCLEDCVFELHDCKEFTGRSHIISFYRQTLNDVPDAVLIAKPSKIDAESIFAKFIFAGTKIFKTTADDPTTLMSVSSSGKDPHENPCTDLFAKYRSNDQAFMAYARGAIQLIVDVKKCKIRRFVIEWNIFSIMDSQDDVQDCLDSYSFEANTVTQKV